MRRAGGDVRSAAGLTRSPARRAGRSSRAESGPRTTPPTARTSMRPRVSTPLHRPTGAGESRPVHLQGGRRATSRGSSGTPRSRFARRATPMGVRRRTIDLPQCESAVAAAAPSGAPNVRAAWNAVTVRRPPANRTAACKRTGWSFGGSLVCLGFVLGERDAFLQVDGRCDRDRGPVWSGSQVVQAVGSKERFQLAAWASAEGLHRVTMAGASCTRLSFWRASVMKSPKSVRRVMLLSRTLSPT